MPKDPFLRFRVRPVKKSRLFFEVRVYETMKDLAVGITDLPKGKQRQEAAKPDVEACCLSWFRPEERADRPKGEIGVMAFSAADTTASTLAHESFHAALAWAFRTGLIHDLDTDNPEAVGTCETEEQIAYALDYMLSQISARWRR